MSDIAKRGNSRVFLIEGRARPDHTPVYKSCYRAGAADWPFGDTTRVECPDPDNYEQYVEVAEILGARERASTDLQARFPLNEASDLLRIGSKRCALDIHAHFGKCTDPSNFDTYEKAVVYESARLGNWGTDEMGSLSSDDENEVNETAPLTATAIREYLNLGFAERGQDAVTNPLVDVVICDTASCGDCEDESDGCEKIYAVDDGATGSPGTAPDLIWSLDKGATLNAEEINSLESGQAASALACVGIYVVVVSAASVSHHYKQRSLLGDGVTDWTEVAYNANGPPNDIWSVGTYAFAVGNGGYVYGFSDPTGAPTVLDAGLADNANLNAVHALNDEFAVAVGAGDAIIYTRNRTTWQVSPAVTASVGNGGGGMALNAVWIKNENEWFVGSDVDANGICLFYTLDGGITWATIALPGPDWTAVNDIQMADDSVVFVAADRAGTPRGYILKSINGGNSFVILPRTGVLPLTDSLVALAACRHDPNFVVVVGTGDAPAPNIDGIFIVGED